MKQFNSISQWIGYKPHAATRYNVEDATFNYFLYVLKKKWSWNHKQHPNIGKIALRYRRTYSKWLHGNNVFLKILTCIEHTLVAKFSNIEFIQLSHFSLYRVFVISRVVFNGAILFSEFVFLTAVTWFIIILAHHFITNRLTAEQRLQIVQIYFQNNGSVCVTLFYFFFF